MVNYERSLFERSYYALGTAAVPQGTSSTKEYECAAQYFALVLTAMQHVSAVLTNVIHDETDVDVHVDVDADAKNEFYTIERHNGFSPHAFRVYEYVACPESASTPTPSTLTAPHILSAPVTSFWSLYVWKILKPAMQNPDGARALYLVSVHLQMTAMAPMGHRLVKVLAEAGVTGVLPTVLRAQLLALSGRPENDTVASYAPADVPERLKTLSAITSADVEAAAGHDYVPVAAMQHFRSFSGPADMLCDAALQALQDAAVVMCNTSGDRVANTVLQAAEIAGVQTLYALGGEDVPLIDARHLQWRSALYDLSVNTLDGLWRHKDPEYLKDELFKRPSATDH